MSKEISGGTSQMKAIYMTIIVISIDIPLNCSTGPQTIAKHNQLDVYMPDRNTCQG